MDWRLEVIVLPVRRHRSRDGVLHRQARVQARRRPPGRRDVSRRAADAAGFCRARSQWWQGTWIRPRTSQPGSVKGLHLVVPDIEAAHAELIERGAEPSGIFHFEAGGQMPGPDPERNAYGSFISFSDPDGNGWLVQEVRRAA